MTFQQGSQFGYLNPDRLTITPINSFADGSTNQDGVPVDTRVDLHGLINTFSLYATDTINVGKSLAFTVSGRYNRTSIDNADRLPPDPTGVARIAQRAICLRAFQSGGRADLQSLRASPTSYFSYSEASRAPTAIELGCADPNEPCNLPNALVSDPPLKQVVTRTLEAGVRGRWKANCAGAWAGSAGKTTTIFCSWLPSRPASAISPTSARRGGKERKSSLSGRFKKFTLGGNYTFLDATYQSSQTVDGGSNSANDGGPGMDGNITVQPGDRIPQIPRNIFKAYATIKPTAKILGGSRFRWRWAAPSRAATRIIWTSRTALLSRSGILARLWSREFRRALSGAEAGAVFVQINNLLNHRYYTAAQLGPSPFDNSGNFIARPFPAVDGNFPIRTTTFFAPGAPIGAWGGIRF